VVIDGSKNNIDYIKKEEIYWRFDLTAIHNFIMKENINKIIATAGLKDDIGLLSIDIDGNDYWVWEAINVINPRIVICEYKSIFGKKHPISIPYQHDFHRAKAHYSYLYYGVSLPALCHLANKKGYDFVGSNSNGGNAFFVRKDLKHNLKKLKAEQGFIENKARESRDRNGRLNFLSNENILKEIKDCKVQNVITNEITLIKDLFFIK
ncbi:MAG: hypothetical protein JXA68_10770, partial [Ignavibacteriales bacterium]|nr:hypothetical protein [Ignavibacteriales bacterium]